jgi:uncharacterized protein YdcH (DUF465 family)
MPFKIKRAIIQKYYSKRIFMFSEDREIVSILKQSDKHFHNIFDKHNALDDKIAQEGEHLNDLDLEKLKKEKLKLKDELYAMIVAYKAANNA